MFNRLKPHLSIGSLLESNHLTQPIYYYAKNAARIYSIEKDVKKNLHYPEIILVYQMGKVGSSTLFQSLNQSLSHQGIYHIHTLNPELIKEVFAKKKLHQQFYTNHRYALAHHFIVSRCLSRNLSLLKQKKLKVITAIRDPVARNISAFFEHREKTDRALTDRTNSLQIEEIIAAFWEEQKESKAESFQDRWFNQELKATLGIDLLSKPFNKESGYEIFLAKGKTSSSTLVIKLEHFSHCLEKAISEFLQEEIKIKNKNLGRRKFYSELYQQFKQKIEFPQVYLEKIYSQECVRHFYSEAEINQFMNKWLRKKQ